MKIPFSVAIRKRRNQMDYTQEDMAKEISKYSPKQLGRSSYNKWESGSVKNPEFQKVKILCDKLGLPINSIELDNLGNLVIEDDTTLPHSALTHREFEIIHKFRDLDEYGKNTIDLLVSQEYKRCKQQIPIYIHTLPYYDFPAAAGTGNRIDEVQPSFIETEGNVPDGAKFIVPISGASMEPKFHDGDRVFIQPVEDGISVGEIGIFIVDGDVFIKELGENVLISLNKEFPDIDIDGKEYRCQGRVLGKVNKKG